MIPPTSHSQIRWLILPVAVFAAFLLLSIMQLIFPAEHSITRMFFNHGMPGYPFSIQLAAWIVFFLGVGEIFMGFRHAKREAEEMKKHYLPMDETTLLVSKDLGEIFKKVTPQAQNAFLPAIVRRIILQYRVNESTDEARGLLASSLEIESQRIELSHSALRYYLWLIPTLGFIGTVMGISGGLAIIGASSIGGDSDDLLPKTIRELAVAFDTTFVSLILAAVLMALYHRVQHREEMLLTQLGEFCQDHLINRLIPTANRPR